MTTVSGFYAIITEKGLGWRNHNSNQWPRVSSYSLKFLPWITWNSSGVLHKTILRKGASDFHCPQMTHVADKRRFHYAKVRAYPPVWQRSSAKVKSIKKLLVALKFGDLPHSPHSPDFHLFRSQQHFPVDELFNNAEGLKTHLSYFGLKICGFLLLLGHAQT